MTMLSSLFAVLQEGKYSLVAPHDHHAWEAHAVQTNDKLMCLFKSRRDYVTEPLHLPALISAAIPWRDALLTFNKVVTHVRL